MFSQYDIIQQRTINLNMCVSGSEVMRSHSLTSTISSQLGVVRPPLYLKSSVRSPVTRSERGNLEVTLTWLPACVTCLRYAALKQVCSLGLKPVQELHRRLLCRVKRKEWDLFWTWAR